MFSVRIPPFGGNPLTSRHDIIVEASPFYVQRLSRLKPVERRLVLDAVDDLRDRRRWSRNLICSGDLLLNDEAMGTIFVRRLSWQSVRPYVVYQFHKPDSCFVLVKLVYTGTYTLMSDGTEEFDDF